MRLSLSRDSTSFSLCFLGKLILTVFSICLVLYTTDCQSSPTQLDSSPFLDKGLHPCFPEDCAPSRAAAQHCWDSLGHVLGWVIIPAPHVLLSCGPFTPHLVKRVYKYLL